MRIPVLLGIPAAVRFVSVEPMLGPVDLDEWLCNPGPSGVKYGGWSEEICGDPLIDWTIAGGESGPHARPPHPDWFRGLRDQCVAAGTPFFFKQWGEWFPRSQWEYNPDIILPDDGHYAINRCHAFDDGTLTHRVGRKRAGAMLEGQEWKQFPGDEV